MRNTIIIISLILLQTNCKSQSHSGYEQYYYTGVGEPSFVPKIYYQSAKNWYGEIRYNYEEFQTVSIDAGKTFSNNTAFSYSVTPLAGMVFGKLNGGNVGSNISLNYKNIFFSSESQFTFSVEKTTENFFFDWSELGYQLNKFFYAGVALQFTHPFEIKNKWQPGFMVGVTYNQWTIPFYAFNPGAVNENFVVGIDWEWKGEKSKPEGL